MQHGMRKDVKIVKEINFVLEEVSLDVKQGPFITYSELDWKPLFHIHQTDRSLILTTGISISNITKDNFSSKVYEDKAERIFFRICLCSTIAYAPSLVLMAMLCMYHQRQIIFSIISGPARGLDHFYL